MARPRLKGRENLGACMSKNVNKPVLMCGGVTFYSFAQQRPFPGVYYHVIRARVYLDLLVSHVQSRGDNDA